MDVERITDPRKEHRHADGGIAVDDGDGGEQRVSDDAQGTDGILTAIEDPSIRPEGEPDV